MVTPCRMWQSAEGGLRALLLLVIALAPTWGIPENDPYAQSWAGGPRRAIIHVGPHKTGSTTIQTELIRNFYWLGTDGVATPSWIDLPGPWGGSPLYCGGCKVPASQYLRRRRRQQPRASLPPEPFRIHLDPNSSVGRCQRGQLPRLVFNGRATTVAVAPCAIHRLRLE